VEANAGSSGVKRSGLMDLGDSRMKVGAGDTVLIATGLRERP